MMVPLYEPMLRRPRGGKQRYHVTGPLKGLKEFEGEVDVEAIKSFGVIKRKDITIPVKRVEELN